MPCDVNENNGELLPCPFCGNEDLHLATFEDPNTYFVECDGCRMALHAFHTKESAIRAWNTRHNVVKK